MMVGNPYLRTIQNWDDISYSRQQVIRSEYPEIPEISREYEQWNSRQNRINEGVEDFSVDILNAYMFVKTFSWNSVKWVTSSAMNLFKSRKVVKAIERNATKIEELTSNQKGKIAEKYVGELLGKDGRPQVSYSWKKEVKYGTGPGVRIDYIYKNKIAIEVKNWNIAKNTSGLVSNVVDQVKKRVIHLPDGMKQEIWIYIKGKKVTKEMFRKVQDKIVEKCNGVIQHKDIKPIGGKPE